MAAPLASYHDSENGRVMGGKQLQSQSPSIRAVYTKRAKPARPYWDWVLEHQIEVSSGLILAVLFLHAFFPLTRTYTRKFIHLSYPSKDGQTYRQGTDDLYFVAAWVITFTALRAITIEWFLRPFARWLSVTGKNQMRVAEQGWLVLYYGTFWVLGMLIWVNSPYWLNHKALWTSWPGRDMSGIFKWYYLVQFSFWVQQILVIHMEARRKDHAQMLTHHVITCTLIFVTYVYRYYRVANVVLCLMDVVDLLFPIAKILRYFGHEMACNVAFGLFVLTWFITRHVLYLQLCWSIYVNVPAADTMQYGCYSGTTDALLPDIPAQPDFFGHLFWPFKDLDGPVCLNKEVKWIFLGMLLMLQALSMIWFGMIISVIIGILRGGNAEDIRSDGEDEYEDVGTDVQGYEERTRKGRPMNVTDLNVCVDGGSSATGSSRRLGALSPKPTMVTRRSLLDSEKRKELLARIGCDKPVGG